MKTTSKILLGTLAGTALGVTAGIFLSPGRKQESDDSTASQSGQLKEDLSNKVQQSVDRMNALTASAFQLINDYKLKLKKESQEKPQGTENYYNTF